MKRIFVASPLRGDIEKNLERARSYCRKVVEAGHRPFAPHLLYPQFLNELDEQERNQGIEMGLQDLQACDELWAFGYLSAGMRKEVDFALKHHIPCLWWGPEGELERPIRIR